MRWLFILASVLLTVALACGTDSTPSGLTETSAISPTQPPAATPAARAPGPTAVVAAPASTPSDSGRPAATPTPAPTRRPLSAAQSQPNVVEDAILYRLGPEPPTLDPHLAGDTDSALYIVEIFGGLVTINQHLEIVGDLAKDWDISNGGKTTHST